MFNYPPPPPPDRPDSQSIAIATDCIAVADFYIIVVA